MKVKQVYSQEALEKLVDHFEQRTLQKEEWTHHAHLIVAAWYATHYEPREALMRIRENIKAYNEAVGTPNSDTRGYHETITRFWLWAVRSYLNQHPSKSFEEACNELLYSDAAKRSHPLHYYSRDVLFSVEARHNFIRPDLKQVDLES